MITPVLALLLMLQTPSASPQGAVVDARNGPAAFEQVRGDAARINATLDAMHAAASRADGKTYFDQYARTASFIGTDATERWDLDQFKAYATPFFARGQGWTYHPRPDRTIRFHGDWALFDEVLDHDSYGVLRGSGALHRTDDGWKIEQYVLSFAVPNDKADSVVDLIRGTPEP